MHQLIDGILGNFTSNFTSEEGSQNIGLCVCVVSGTDPVALVNDQNSICPKQTCTICHQGSEQGIKNGNVYSLLTAFPGNPNIPPASEWNGQYAVIVPKKEEKRVGE